MVALGLRVFKVSDQRVPEGFWQSLCQIGTTIFLIDSEQTPKMRLEQRSEKSSAELVNI